MQGAHYQELARDQESLKAQARDFAAQSADRLKQGIVDGFNSKESRGALQAMRKRALDAVLNLKQADIHTMLDDPDLETQIQWAKDFLSHNLARQEIYDALKEQIVAALEREKDRTLEEVIKDAGLEEIAKPWLRDHFPFHKSMNLRGANLSKNGSIIYSTRLPAIDQSQPVCGKICPIPPLGQLTQAHYSQDCLRG